MTRAVRILFFRILSGCLLVIAVGTVESYGQFARLEKNDWEANWIWRPGEQYANAWVAYRKTFDLATDPTEAVANIAVDSKYWLWVNGEIVVREGGLKRGPTPNDTYYDVVDFTEHLRAGSNTIAILVWYWGRSGFSHIDSGKGGLLFEGTVDGSLIKSDGTWISQRHPAFGWSNPPVPNGELSESNIAFDARNDMSNWMKPEFDAGSWKPAVVQAAPPGLPWNRLFERPIPQWSDSGLQPYQNGLAFPFESTGDTLIAQLPHNAQVTPYFRIEAPAGLVIDMRTDHYSTLSLDRVTKIYSVRTEYTTRDGEQEFETPAWMSGEKVHYHFPQGVRVLDLAYRESAYDSDFEGWFTSSDDFLDRLWEKARRTVAVSMRDYFMETADRERKQATGDGSIAILSALYSFDNRVIPLIQKFWSEFDAWRTPGGVFLSGVPGNWPIELAQQNLFAFGDLGLWNYYLHTGDSATIEAMYPAVRKYLLLWDMAPNGLVEHRQTAWNWFDWGVNIDEPLIENAWYYLALHGAVKMAELTQNWADIPEWTARMEQLGEAYNRVFWDNDRYHTPGQYGEPDDRGNALAVLAGLPTASMRGHLKRLLRRQRHSSPYMENFAEAALFQLGDADEAINRMKGRYCEMIESEGTTLWEFWDPNVASKSHQFGSGTLRTLSYYVAGIQPLAPGFRRMLVAPNLGSLDWVDAGAPTPMGMVKVRVERRLRVPFGTPSLTMNVSIPAGATAVVGVPIMPGVIELIQAGDKVVWQDDQGVSGVPGIRPLDKTSTHVHFEIQPGEWEFKQYLKPDPAQFNDVGVYPGGDRRAVIKWNASDELAGTDYVVEERLNEEFESIGRISGRGSSDVTLDYEHEVSELTAGLHTYRVMATTDDGCYVFSEVVSYEVPMNASISASSVYPNPMDHGGRLVLAVGEPQRISVEILNAVGQRVMQLMDQYLIPDEQYHLDIDASRLPAGVYAVVASGKSRSSRQFVVVH